MMTLRKDEPKRPDGIYGRGRAGDVVVLDQVSYGKKPDPEQYPLAQFAQPALLRIDEVMTDPGKPEGWHTIGYKLTALDGTGRTVRIEIGDTSNLRPAQAWLDWKKAHDEWHAESTALSFMIVEAKLGLLTGIMSNQGVRVVSVEQAKQLGIAAG